MDDEKSLLKTQVNLNNLNHMQSLCQKNHSIPISLQHDSTTFK